VLWIRIRIPIQGFDDPKIEKKKMQLRFRSSDPFESGSTTLLRSVHWITAPDPAFLLSGFQDANKK
jgi:hypothetical protein